MHSFTHSLIRSFIRSFISSCIPRFTRSLFGPKKRNSRTTVHSPDRSFQLLRRQSAKCHFFVIVIVIVIVVAAVVVVCPSNETAQIRQSDPNRSYPNQSHYITSHHITSHRTIFHSITSNQIGTGSFVFPNRARYTKASVPYPSMLMMLRSPPK
mmetsp:Transcript_8652/g.25604  ORF Transcript_8652/g.25604 Transcript_8652/m.25604 type:complete len:154 (+) Transcript_8652:117-578(+)